MTIGLAVISYNRPLYLEQCLYNLDKNSWGGASVRVVIIDEEYSTKYQWLDKYEADNEDVLVWYQPNAGVAAAKNQGLKLLAERGGTDFFLMEDDILMKNFLTCNLYASYAKEAGVHHMNFAHHGPMNNGRGRQVKFNGVPVTVYPDCIGAFSYYTKACLDKVGVMDENFKNAWEHVEHTWRIGRAQMTTPFWYFIDHPDSDKLLEEIPGSIDSSSIRVRPDWNKNIEEGAKHWQAKHGQWLPDRPKWHVTN